MRLINTTTFETKEFMGTGAIPDYAILSHTWEDDEVSFQDMQDQRKASAKKGFRKVSELCRQSVEDDLHWAWMDTCCIDKTSSAELTEAINSMFKWYASSKVCYAYVSDVSSRDDWAGLVETATTDSREDQKTDVKPRWFSRGWTLQELLAPRNVRFFSASWEYLGDKVTLQHFITPMTGIAARVLEHRTPPSDVPVATRMHWASKRETTRDEDKAYCLLGLFDANMPLLYGEGLYKAFQRLQEQILKITEDQTIFLRRSLQVQVRLHGEYKQETLHVRNWGGLHGSILAQSPAEFIEPCQFEPVFSNRFHDAQFATRERGLRLSLLMKKMQGEDYRRILDFKGLAHDHGDLYMAALNCRKSSQVSRESLEDIELGIQAFPAGSTAIETDPRLRVVIFLRRLTRPESRTETPLFVRLERFYHLLLWTEVIEWDFMTCYVVQSNYPSLQFDATEVKISTRLPYRIGEYVLDPRAEKSGERSECLAVLHLKAEHNLPDLSCCFCIRGQDLGGGLAVRSSRTDMAVYNIADIWYQLYGVLEWHPLNHEPGRAIEYRRSLEGFDAALSVLYSQEPTRRVFKINISIKETDKAASSS
ncbi:heterokaryon incompatibility protein-domain-containing protein [Xylariales sp. AK1849]|nr:heterokaryon incompatibility protein-domain-containing protein [Xylariales sp. AK1849]